MNTTTQSQTSVPTMVVTKSPISVPPSSRWNSMRRKLLKGAFRVTPAASESSKPNRRSSHHQFFNRRTTAVSTNPNEYSTHSKKVKNTNEKTTTRRKMLINDEETAEHLDFARDEAMQQGCSPRRLRVRRRSSSVSTSVANTVLLLQKADSSSSCSNTVVSDDDEEDDEVRNVDKVRRRVRFTEEEPTVYQLPQHEDETSDESSLWWTKKERYLARKTMSTELKQLRSNVEYLRAIALVLFYAKRKDSDSSSGDTTVLPDAVRDALTIVDAARGLERYIVHGNNNNNGVFVIGSTYDLSKAPKRSVSTIVRVQHNIVDNIKDKSLANLYQPFSKHAVDWSNLLGVAAAATNDEHEYHQVNL